ncbi:MAG: hypothetical protein JSU87_12900 [Gemmatimonadota bacterium]|nr:MAG: hypothetical protein JSU87_12900 [Gemmatimonadota bacterium]
MALTRGSARWTWLILLAALGCAGDGTGLDGPPNGNQEVSFATDVQPIFTASCAFSGCHGGSSPQLGMNLSAGQAYANIVNVASVEVPGLMRIRPDLPDSSYLVHKIQGTQASVGGSGGQMPLSNCCLSTEQIDLIRAWVEDGAPDN